MGEHLLPPFNKREPYETDVQLPLYILGPNINRRTLTHPSQHTDLARTFLHLAKAESYAPLDQLDGMSLVPLFTPGVTNSTPWRQHSCSNGSCSSSVKSGWRPHYRPLGQFRAQLA